MRKRKKTLTHALFMSGTILFCTLFRSPESESVGGAVSLPVPVLD